MIVENANTLFKKACKLAAERPIPERYNLNDDPDNFPDFVYIRIRSPENNEKFDFLIKSVIGQYGVDGILFGEELGEKHEFCVPWSLIKNMNCSITRVYKTVSRDFQSLSAFMLWEKINFIKLEHAFKKIRDVIAQRRFDLNLRVRTERLEILSEIVEIHRKKIDDFSVFRQSDDFHDVFDLFSAIYSDRIWTHSNRDKLLGDFEFILLSLVATGDLEQKEASRFAVNPKALQTLSQFALEERKHDDQVRQSKYLVWLTLVLATAAVFQILDVLKFL